MSYTIRVMPVVYLSFDLPSNIKTEDEAIKYVSQIAKEMSSKVWLYLSRIKTICINEDGKILDRIKVTSYQAQHTHMNFQ